MDLSNNNGQPDEEKGGLSYVWEPPQNHEVGRLEEKEHVLRILGLSERVMAVM